MTNTVLNEAAAMPPRVLLAVIGAIVFGVVISRVVRAVE